MLLWMQQTLHFMFGEELLQQHIYFAYCEDCDYLQVVWVMTTSYCMSISQFALPQVHTEQSTSNGTTLSKMMASGLVAACC